MAYGTKNKSRDGVAFAHSGFHICGVSFLLDGASESYFTALALSGHATSAKRANKITLVPPCHRPLNLPSEEP